MKEGIYYEFRENHFDMIRKRNKLIEERERNKQTHSYPIHTPIKSVEQCSGYKKLIPKIHK